ncbi:hypothetical protein ACVNP0_06205 [Staphylococcus aureus]
MVKYWFIRMLIYGVEHKAKFVKQFADFSVGVDGLKQYDEEVKSGGCIRRIYV